MYTLKNGESVPLSGVVTCQMLLKTFSNKKPQLFLDIYKKCCDDQYQFTEQVEEELKRCAIADIYGRLTSIAKEVTLGLVESGEVKLMEENAPVRVDDPVHNHGVFRMPEQPREAAQNLAADNGQEFRPDLALPGLRGLFK